MTTIYEVTERGDDSEALTLVIRRSRVGRNMPVRARGADGKPLPNIHLETELKIGARLRHKREGHRIITITSFSDSGRWVYVKRNTSRRTQPIDAGRLLDDYELGGW